MVIRSPIRDDGVSYRRTINLTATQKARARLNIGVGSFADWAEVAATSIPAGQSQLTVDAYSTATGLGRANFKRVDSEPTHDLKIQSADGAWFEFDEDECWITQAGAYMDGTTSDHAAWQRAVDWAKTRRGVVRIPAGNTLVDDEIDFTGITGSMSIHGSGFRHSIIYVTPFGAAKKLFKGCNTDTDTRPMEYCLFRDFEIQGRNSANTTLFASADHPIGLYLPYCTADRVINVIVRGLGNTAFWASSANNLRMHGCQALGCGYSFTKDDALSTGATMSGTTGSATITATAAVFSAGHVGKNFHVQGAGVSGFPKAFVIDAVAGDGLSCTVDQNPTRDFSGGRGTLEGMAGDITATDTTLTSDTAVFRDEDVGRYIYVEGAGDSGAMLVTTIASYTNTTEVELTDAAVTSVTGAFFHFTPAFFIGEISADLADTRGLNDAILTETVCESCHSVDYLFGPGVNLHLTRGKSHGLGTDGVTRPGRNVRNMILDGVRSGVFKGSEFDYGYAKDSGNILICGGQSLVMLADFQAGSITEGQYFIDWKTTSADSMIILGPGFYNKTATNEPGFVLVNGSAPIAQIQQSGPILTRESDDALVFAHDMQARYLRVRNTTDSTGVELMRLEGMRSGTAATSDQVYLNWYMKNSAAEATNIGRIGAQITTVTDGSEAGRLTFSAMASGTLSTKMLMSTVSLTPVANDGLALGAATVSWSDLFLASGGVIGWNNGDVTVTHSSNLLTFAGASSGYVFDAGITTASVAAANIANAAHAINTTGKTVGKMIYDTTNNRVMVAAGTETTSAWYIADGSASVTPA